MSSEICKAAIATAFSQNPKIIKTKAISDNIIALQYYRPTDNSLWKYQCKIINSNQVMWRSAGNPSEPNYVGRWRDNPLDGNILFLINGKKLVINDDMSGEKEFSKSQLK
ncbi:hypothetical protein GCM10023078_09610 [Gibbsiella greigii]